MVFARSIPRTFQRPAASLLATSRQWRAPALQRTSVSSGVRTLTASATRQGKVLMVLYDVSSIIHAIRHDLIEDRAASMPNSSQASSVPLRTSSAFASGSRTRVTLW